MDLKIIKGYALKFMGEISFKDKKINKSEM